MTDQTRADRVTVRCNLIVGAGPDAHAELTTPWHTARSPMRVRAGDIAADAGLPVNELPGREFLATGDADGLGDFELLDDPRN